MTFRVIGCFLILVFLLNCNQKSKHSSPPGNDSKTINSLLKSPLNISNGMYRGTTYYDSLNTRFNLRYLPITVTNDTTIPILLDLQFEKEYVHQDSSSVYTYRIIPLPTKWVLDGVGVTDEMFDELPDFLESLALEKALKPGESYLFGIGTLYEHCGILPMELFNSGDDSERTNCDDGLKANSEKSNNQLGLKLNICGNSCILISCGTVTIPNEKDSI